MKIEIAEPPMIAEIAKVFPERPSGVVYAFGDTIYNPGGHHLPRAIVHHEAMHGARQLGLGPQPGSTTQWSGVEVWWRRYLEDVQFRFDEEVYAHAAEMLAQMPRDRNQRQFLLMATANRLCAPFYNYGSTVNYRIAKSALRTTFKGHYSV